MVDFVTTFIVPYVVLIVLGLSVFNAWMLIIIAKKFFIKNTYPKDDKNMTSPKGKDEPEADTSKDKKKEKKKPPSKNVEEAAPFLVA